MQHQVSARARAASVARKAAKKATKPTARRSTRCGSRPLTSAKLVGHADQMAKQRVARVVQGVGAVLRAHVHDQREEDAFAKEGLESQVEPGGRREIVVVHVGAMIVEVEQAKLLLHTEDD